MVSSVYPLLYQVNTRVWLTELGQKLGRPATLDDIRMLSSTTLSNWDSTGSGF